ncbi:MAG TPA: hypothetical protein V6C81_02650 [Planktothrix sp.]|jgi:hypothetical protein
MLAFVIWLIIAVVVVFLTRLYNELRNIGTGRRVSDFPMVAAAVTVVVLSVLASNFSGILGAGIGAAGMALAAKFL